MVREIRNPGAGGLKYELLPDQSIKAGVRKLFRALRDFGDVSAGDIGGYIERELNLSHDGDAWVSGDARVCDDTSICWFSHVGSESGTLTAYTTERGIYCTRGCFTGTLDEFEAAVRETHGDSQIAREYALLIEFIRLRLGAAQARVNKAFSAEGRSDE